MILQFLACLEGLDFIEFFGRQAGKPLGMLVPFFGIFGAGARFVNGRFSVFYQWVRFFYVRWHGDCLCIIASGRNHYIREGV